MAGTVKVAVVGSGLAGLTVAHRLQSGYPHLEVHLFEKATQLGMDASSVSIGHGKDWRVDVPMRSFQGGYYKHLIALYERLGVQFRVCDFSYSFSSIAARRDLRTTLIYNGASGRAGLSMPSSFHAPLFNKPTSLLGYMLNILIIGTAWLLFSVSSVELLYNQFRLCVLAAPWFRPATLSTLTFRDWVEQSTPRSSIARWVGADLSWRCFAHDILVPLFSAVCTAATVDVLDHPAAELLEYVWLTLFTHHYVACHGVRDVVQRLAGPLKHIHLSAHIVDVQRSPECMATLSIRTAGLAGKPDAVHTGFKHLVIATQANQAVPLLSSYEDSLLRSGAPSQAAHSQAVHRLVECLQQFYYATAVVVNHTDSRLMPPTPSDQRELNLITAASSLCTSPIDKASAELCVPSSYTMTTHVLRAPADAAMRVYQTTNPIIAPQRNCILSVAHMQRAVLRVSAKEALSGLASLRSAPGRWRNGWRSSEHWDLGPLQGAGRRDTDRAPGIWVCGSYASGGIPLLEGCVVSANNVAHEIGRLEALPTAQ